MKPLDVLCVGATPGELQLLDASLGKAREGRGGVRPWWWGRVGELRVGVLACGVGKANAALALGPVLESTRPDVVLAVGVAGAYPGSSLAVGEAAVAAEEIYGDEGVETPHGFRGMEETALPLWEAGRARYFNRFPADPGVNAVLAGCGAGAARLGTGPFLTLSTVTGTRERALELECRYAALCETMEGAAFAHAAAAYGAAFGEVRGVSNPVGPRDRASWKIAEAAGAAQEVALRFLHSWPARSA